MIFKVDKVSPSKLYILVVTFHIFMQYFTSFEGLEKD